MAYRAREELPDEIVIVGRSSTFWMRLRMNLRVNAKVFALSVAPLVVLVTGFAGVTAAVGGASFGGPAFAIGGGLLGFVALAFIVRVVAVSWSPSPAEQLLPRQLRFCEGYIEVTPKNRAAYEARWTWIVEAREVPGALVLVLGRDPHMEWRVVDATLGEAKQALLRRWLRQEGILRP